MESQAYFKFFIGISLFDIHIDAESVTVIIPFLKKNKHRKLT